MRADQQVFRSPPIWVWPALLADLAFAASAGYLLGWRAAAVAGLGVSFLVLALRTKVAPSLIVPLLGLSVLVPSLILGVAVLRSGGIELGRDNTVDTADVLAASAVPGAVVNPFEESEPHELFLVGLDAASQQRLPGLAVALEERFGMAATQAAPLLLDVGVLDPARAQLDGEKITSRLLTAYESVHSDHPAVVIAVTRLDVFFSRIPDYRFVFMASGVLADGAICGGVISTARFDVWPGSEEKRLEKMSARLLGRCIGIEEDVSILSISDVDGLDDRAGADAQTIARQVAERRALPGAPRG
jgi:hypothetical protein